MKPNPAAEEIPPTIKAAGDTQFTSRVSKARHDLHNSVGHIVGFSEMWVEEFREQNSEVLQVFVRPVALPEPDGRRRMFRSKLRPLLN